MTAKTLTNEVKALIARQYTTWPASVAADEVADQVMAKLGPLLDAADAMRCPFGRLSCDDPEDYVFARSYDQARAALMGET